MSVLRSLQAPSEQSEITRFADRMIQYIKDRWPVDTGTSRDRWLYYLNPTPGEMAVIVENEMYDADEVVGPDDPDGKPLYRQLIPKAFSQIKDERMAAVLAAVDKTQDAIARGVAADQTLREATLAPKSGG